MVDLDKQEAEIGPRRGIAHGLGSELIRNLSTDRIIMIEGVAVCDPEKDEISYTEKKAREQEPEPSFAPPSPECGKKYEDQAENYYFFFNPKYPASQQAGQKI